MLSLPVLDIFLDENVLLNGANKRESRRGEDPGKEQIYVTRASSGSSLAGPGRRSEAVPCPRSVGPELCQWSPHTEEME